jgi:hypothetical protein
MSARSLSLENVQRCYVSYGVGVSGSAVRQLDKHGLQPREESSFTPSFVVAGLQTRALS